MHKRADITGALSRDIGTCVQSKREVLTSDLTCCHDADSEYLPERQKERRPLVIVPILTQLYEYVDKRHDHRGKVEHYEQVKQAHVVPCVTKFEHLVKQKL